MRNDRFLALLLLLVLLSTAACGHDRRRGVGPKVEEHSQYELASAFNVQTDFGDATVGARIDMLRDMSDDADDPGRFVVEQVTGKLPWPLDSAAEPLVDVLAPDVNAVILGNVPAVEEIQGLAEGLSNIARVFEVQSFLDVGLDAKGRYTASHQVTGIHFGFRSLSLDLTGDDLASALPTERIAVRLEDGLMIIPAHQLPMPMGTAISKALDGLVVPAVAPGVASYNDLVARWFACADIAATIANGIDGPDDVVLDACLEASESVAGKLTAKFADLDAKAGLKLAGQATFDAVSGTWTGQGWSGVFMLGDGSAADLDPATCAFDLTVVTPPSP